MLNQRELAAIIENEIALLPKKMRRVFELSRKSYLSYKEISEELSISEETVKKQIHNAIKTLRFKLTSIFGVLIAAFFLVLGNFK